MSTGKNTDPAPNATSAALDKFIDSIKITFNRLLNLDDSAQSKSKLAADDEFIRQLIEEKDPVLTAWTSVGVIKANGKAGTKTRKWLLLWSNGNLSYVNRGTTRTPENAISASGKNVKAVTNATAEIKGITFDGYKMILQGVQDAQIEITLDPKSKPNLEAAKKFATKVKKFI